MHSTVSSSEWWFDTGIELQAHKTYTLKATGTWNDADIECGPEGWTLDQIDPWKHKFFRAVEMLRPLDTGDRWFCLLGKVGKEVFEIGEHFEYTPSTSGTLHCTPNDVPLAFWNNKGAIELTVE